MRTLYLVLQQQIKSQGRIAGVGNDFAEALVVPPSPGEVTEQSGPVV